MKTKKPAVKKLTIGLDLGDRHHHACVLDAVGEIVAREVIGNTREVLIAFCARDPGATVVMETARSERVRLKLSTGQPLQPFCFKFRPDPFGPLLWAARIRRSLSTAHPRAEVAEHERRLVEVPQAPAQPQPIIATAYARDIRAVLRQKSLHAAAMRRTRFIFHTTALSLWSRPLQLWLRRQPR